MNAGATFIAHGEPAKPMQPRERAFDDPAGPAQPTAMGRPALGERRPDAPRPERQSMGLRVIAAIALDHVGFAARPAVGPAQRRNGVDQGQELRYVVPVRRREARDERNPVGVGKNMMFRPGFAAIGRVRSSFFPPRNARSEALSTTARAKSRRPCRRSSVRRAPCKRFHTPARCQRTNRRQQVVPEPQPISLGSMFHGNPLLSTKRIPVSTARSGIGLRPAYCRWRERRFGSSGSIWAHKASSIKVMRDRLVGHGTVPTLVAEYKRVVT